MKIYIINLLRSVDRHSHMLSELRKHSLTDFEFIEAVAHASPIHGCMKSHRKVWERIAKDDKPAIVLEDDVILHDSFYHHLHQRWNDCMAESCHVALIGYQIKGQPVYSHPCCNWRSGQGKVEFNGAYGYIVTGKLGAKHLLKLSDNVPVHPDIMMQDAANEGKLTLFFMNFPLVKHGSFESTLNHNAPQPTQPVVVESKPTVVKSKPQPKGKIRLFINWYNEKNKARAKELAFCLNKNLKFDWFDEVIDISETPALCSNTKKVNIQGRPTFADFFNVVNQVAAPNDISVIANLDIFFDKTILEAHRLEKRDCFALTRWDSFGIGTSGAVFFNRADSQDVWIFRGKIKKIKGANFTMGEQGCDNKLAYLLHKAGYNVTNPSLTIKTYHLHTSPVRHADPKKMLKPPYKLLIPSL